MDYFLEVLTYNTGLAAMAPYAFVLSWQGRLVLQCANGYLKSIFPQILWIGAAGISGLEGVGLPGKFGANELGYNQIAAVKWFVDNASRSSPLFEK